MRSGPTAVGPAQSGVSSETIRDNCQRANGRRMALRLAQSHAHPPRRVAPESGPAFERRRDVVLDSKDAGIELSIQRIQRKSFIRDTVIPEIQLLLILPAEEAKTAFLGLLNQYALASMLILASLLGVALNPLDLDGSYPETGRVAAFNMMAMIISCANLFATCTFVLTAVVCEGTPADAIHSVIARADRVFFFGTFMLSLGLQGMAPLIVLRGWVSGLDQAQCIALSIMVAVFYVGLMDFNFCHVQDAHPVKAQFWVKFLWPLRYKKQPSHAAVDELVAQLRYLQQPRDKMLSSAQLGLGLDAYFSSADLLRADEEAFLTLLEGQAGGRLAPTMERLARAAFEKVLAGALEKLADEAILARGPSAVIAPQ